MQSTYNVRVHCILSVPTEIEIQISILKGAHDINSNVNMDICPEFREREREREKCIFVRPEIGKVLTNEGKSFLC